MSERLTPEILEEFKKMELEPVKTKIRAKNLIKFAKAIGTKQKKYLDKDNPLEHPAYLGTIVVKALLGLAEASIEYKGEQVKLILNPFYVVHGGQDYEFTDVHVKDGDILLTTGKLTELYIKNGMLFIVATCHTKNEAGELLLTTRISGICRAGGF